MHDSLNAYQFLLSWHPICIRGVNFGAVHCKAGTSGVSHARAGRFFTCRHSCASRFCCLSACLSQPFSQWLISACPSPFAWVEKHLGLTWNTITVIACSKPMQIVLLWLDSIACIFWVDSMCAVPIVQTCYSWPLHVPVPVCNSLEGRPQDCATTHKYLT